MPQARGAAVKPAAPSAIDTISQGSMRIGALPMIWEPGDSAAPAVNVSWNAASGRVVGEHVAALEPLAGHHPPGLVGSPAMPVKRACDESATYDASCSSTPSGASASDQRTVDPSSLLLLSRDPGERLVLPEPGEQQPGAEAGRSLGPLVALLDVADRGDVEVRPRHAADEVLQEQRRGDRRRRPPGALSASATFELERSS